MCTKLFKLIICFLVLGLGAGLAEGQIDVVKINFQQESAEVPEGYLPDTGLEFGDRGNGFSYGWDHDVTGSTRQRSGGADQRYNSLAQFEDEPPPAIWEIGLPNGTYDLFIVCADPEHSNQIHNLDVEGVVVLDPDGGDEIDEFNVTVPVSDGRLSIQQGEGAYNGKFAFIDIVLAVPPTAARTPSPEDGATDVPRDGIVLEWTAGQYAASHDVYFGEIFEDVNAATPDSDAFIGNQQGTAAALDRLELEKTYYWRVDEVNAAPDSTVYKGETWSFTVEPVGYPIPGENITATASSQQAGDMGPENTINGSGLDAEDLHSREETDTWLSEMGGPQPTCWIQYEFDKLYKLHQMWVWNSNTGFESFFGLGIKDATIEYSTDGTDWTVLEDVPEFAKAPGEAGYAHNTEVDLGGVIAKYIKITANSNWGGGSQYGLSEVRFFNVPVRARATKPSAGETDVAVDVVLSWRAGRQAAEHVVYLDTSEQVVEDGQNAVDIVSEASYDPGALQLSETYYWRVDEVNEAETLTTWQGDIWSFTTQEFFIVDDFEDYNDYPPDEIWATWVDGYGVPTNGSTVGYPEPDWNQDEHYVETTIVYGGSQSMPFFYDNTGTAAYSEAERTFAVAQDWTANGVQFLVLYFYGYLSDLNGHLYVKINDQKIVYTLPAEAIIAPEWRIWTQWAIDLSSIEGLTDVKTMSIGVEGAGLQSVVYVDDIELAAAVAGGLIENLVVYDAESAANWSIQTNIQEGVVFYGDRGYTIASLPAAYAGLEWIRTANDATDSWDDDPIASFFVNADCTVYVAWDNRDVVPDFAADWTDTGDVMKDSADDPQVTFNIYSKSYSAGSTVTLGTRLRFDGDTDANMYIVMVAPTG